MYYIGTGCRIGQYDVTDLSVKFSANQYLVPSNGPTDGMGISRVNNGTILVCYANSGKGVGECSIGIIDDLATNGIDAKITFQPAVVFNSEGGTDEIKIRRLPRGNSSDNPDFVICYVSENDGACSYLTVDIDGPTDIDLQFKSRTQFAARDTIDQPSIQRIPRNATNLNNKDELLLVCYVDVGIAEDAECVFGVIDQIGKTVTFNDGDKPSVFEDGRTDRIDALYLGGNNVVICYVDINGAPVTNDGPCLFGTIMDVDKKQKS